MRKFAMSLSAGRGKEAKPVVRVIRAFPLFGRRTVMLHFPSSIGHGFKLLPFAEVANANVFVKARPGATPDGPEVYEVRASTISAPIIEMETNAAAKEVVRLLSDALAPNRMKKVWWMLGILLAIWAISAPDRRTEAGPRELSIRTPMAQVAQPAAAPQVSGATAAAGVPASAAPTERIAAPEVDKNDPFGLKIVPPGK